MFVIEPKNASFTIFLFLIGGIDFIIDNKHTIASSVYHFLLADNARNIMPSSINISVYVYLQIGTGMLFPVNILYDHTAI